VRGRAFQVDREKLLLAYEFVTPPISQEHARLRDALLARATEIVQKFGLGRVRAPVRTQFHEGEPPKPPPGTQVPLRGVGR
jgi:hypothetical protein